MNGISRSGFEGTDPQVATNHQQCPFASTFAAAVACLEIGADRSGHSVQRRRLAGHFAVDAPYGSVLNPTTAGAGESPAPCRAHRVFNAVMKALAQVAPERRDGGRLRHHHAGLPQSSGRQAATTSIWRSSAAATAPVSTMTAATASTVRLSNCANIPIEVAGDGLPVHAD